MTIIFKAKTQEAYIIKILAELLQNNIQKAHFQIDEEDIRLKIMDHHKTVLIDMTLFGSEFQLYKFKSKSPLTIGINLNHFHRMLRTIKKKDSLELFINDDQPTNLGIRVIPKENNRTTISYVKIQPAQNIDIDIPDGYRKSISISSSEFQKMCKDMNNIGKVVLIKCGEYHIRFLCDAGGVYSREVVFGETNQEDDTDDDEIIYKQEFKTEQLIKITKLSGLSNNIQIYPKEGLPLLCKAHIGSIGEICLYIKSREQIEEDEKRVDSSDDEN